MGFTGPKPRCLQGVLLEALGESLPLPFEPAFLDSWAHPSVQSWQCSIFKSISPLHWTFTSLTTNLLLEGRWWLCWPLSGQSRIMSRSEELYLNHTCISFLPLRDHSPWFWEVVQEHLWESHYSAYYIYYNLKFCSLTSYFGTFNIKVKVLSVKINVKDMNKFFLSLDWNFFHF